MKNQKNLALGFLWLLGKHSHSRGKEFFWPSTKSERLAHSGISSVWTHVLVIGLILHGHFHRSQSLSLGGGV